MSVVGPVGGDRLHQTHSNNSNNIVKPSSNGDAGCGLGLDTEIPGTKAAGARAGPN